ncbi:glycerophosphocholine phosphodiesterase GPCPD1 [Drosophila kikkawai]|uniref:Glycerophosphocholine phosphodiesterase GPCPD1 n=1 Tax=Drosophila kikkawai TaxID=30033 RepID=A0A6P4INV2_DROKI|nr:glycerophosphocholine phosphodiesterase GPCPD1 [Drosophila kikkawai]
MHRWFFANEREECDPSLNDGLDEESECAEQPEAPPPVPTTEWPFTVVYHRKLGGNEYIGISGNCESLGFWSPKDVFIMAKQECSNCMCKCHTYEAVLTIPRNIDIHYRYCVVVYDPVAKDCYIRFWEAQLKPRVIRTCQNLLKDVDCFGHPHVNDEHNRVDRGWVSTESIVQLKFFNAPFQWQRQKPRLLNVHVTPMYEADIGCKEGTLQAAVRKTSVPRLSHYLSNHDFQNLSLELRMAYTEVANLRSTKPLEFQPIFGVPCGPKDLQLFHCTVAYPEETLYRLDLYTYAHKAASDEPPYHYGYGFLQPNQLLGSEGSAQVKITCASTHRPLMELTVQYLVIRPLQGFQCDMSKSYERYWRKSRLCMDIGHRGSGKTYRNGVDLFRENTIYGFKQAALSNADMVELDVQLTQDAQVVVYHDFVLRFLQQRTPSYEELLENQDLLVFSYEKLNKLMLLCMGGSKRKDHVAVPLEAFTYEQLKEVRVLRFAGSKSCELFCDEMLNDQRPFPLLLELFQLDNEAMPLSVGFNIEIKWPQLDNSRRWEAGSFKPTFDRNLYVDTILKVVLENAGRRRIMFSCSDADICAMVRYKQNLYPVVLLSADPGTPVQYADERVSRLKTAVQVCNSLEFFGLSLHTNTVLEDLSLKSLMRPFDLQVLAWGGTATSAEVRNQLRRFGVVGIIFDRINQLDQMGEELQGGTVCIIDSMTTRPIIREVEVEEWRLKCGYMRETTVGYPNNPEE